MVYVLQIETNDPLGLTKNKKAACEPVGDSYAADRGYVAKVRP